VLVPADRLFQHCHRDSSVRPRIRERAGLRLFPRAYLGDAVAPRRAV